MIQKAYKFRIYPTPKQTVLLAKTFGCVRYAWNSWVAQFNKPKEEKTFLTACEFRKEIEWMKEVSAAAVQQKERDFAEFKKQFFSKKRKKKLGRPAFKSRRNRQSYRLPNQKFDVDQEIRHVRLEKIGWVKTVFDRAIPEDVKFVNATISRDCSGAHYISILVEEEIALLPLTGKEVGVDVGLKSFAVLSDGTEIENPRFFRESQAELRRAQQHLSRKQKGSHRREMARLKVARIHRKTAHQRDWFLHNVSSYLVNNYDVIAIEDLNVAGMQKNHCLAKSISDASWAQLFRQLEYKANWYGKLLRKVDRFEPTSRTCSACGLYNSKLTLSDREWDCPCCGTHHDRDENAAKNILTAARVGAAQQAWSDCQTVAGQPGAADCNEAPKVR